MRIKLFEDFNNKISFDNLKEIVHDILIDLDDRVEYELLNEFGYVMKSIRLKFTSSVQPKDITDIDNILRRLFKVLEEERMVAYYHVKHGHMMKYDGSDPVDDKQRRVFIPWEEKHEYDYSGIYAKCVGVTWEKEFVLYYEN